MHLRLLASCAGKRFDNEPRLSMDGRGGWSLSQINTDRWISDADGYYLTFCFAVLATDAADGDFVEATRLTARMDGELIGTDEHHWKRPNKMWQVMNGEAIFEWPQTIGLHPTRDGLITVAIEAKIQSRNDWREVDGTGFARIKIMGNMPQLEWKLTRPWIYPLVRLVPKRFRRTRTDW